MISYDFLKKKVLLSYQLKLTVNGQGLVIYSFNFKNFSTKSKIKNFIVNKGCNK